MSLLARFQNHWPQACGPVLVFSPAGVTSNVCLVLDQCDIRTDFPGEKKTNATSSFTNVIIPSAKPMLLSGSNWLMLINHQYNLVAES